MNRHLKPNAYMGIIVLLSIVFFLAGCQQEKAVKQPPVDADITQTLTVLYKQAGQAASVDKQVILGKHFKPNTDSWKVVACTELTLTNGAGYTDCNDSFELCPLDSGKWVISGKVNGAYRWLEVLQGGVPREK